MSLLEDLANKRCEKVTSRHGCFNKDGALQEANPCVPCLARQELGRPSEAPRYCDRCGKRMVRVHLSEGGETITGYDESGSDRCEQPPPHTVTRFYDESPSVRRRG